MKVDLLKGTRILLVGYYIPCPFAAYLLRGCGAEVVKIEPPFGDLLRGFPPFLKGKSGEKMSAFFRSFNGGFKSIGVNFKDPDGIEVLRELIKKAHVVLDGNRPGFLEEVLGSKLEQLFPEVVHIPVTAFGSKGPLKDMAGHDNNILAMIGALSFNSPHGAFFGAQVADILAGTMAAFMAVAGLLGRKNPECSNPVSRIDVSMLHAATALTQMYVTAMNCSGKSPESETELLNGGLPNYRSFKTRDGKSIFFGPIENKLFQNFCEKVDRPDLPELLRAFQKKEEKGNRLVGELEGVFRSRSQDEWGALLEKTDCCFTSIRDLREAVLEPQLRELGLVQEVQDETFGKLLMPGFPAGFSSQSNQPEGLNEKAPGLGEHTREILKGLVNLGDEKIQSLYNKKAVC
ncbi:MAG: CaiB/BaiF CoA-transferase family protein [Candidatus Ozemobacteraceae bacterium]